MLVYANKITAEGQDAHSIAIRALHGWFKKTIGASFSIQDISKNNTFTERNNDFTRESAWLKCESITDDEKSIYAWRLKHGDSTVRGRQWIIDLGLIAQKDSIELTCTVQVDDMSTLIQDRVTASRPNVIRFFIENLKESNSRLSKDTPGASIKTVGESIDSYRALRSLIESESRSYPIVIASPDREGKYPANLTKLQDQLIGLAQVVKVVEDFDSYDMEEILSRRWSAWDGSINIIKTKKGSHVGNRLIKSYEIDELKGQNEVIQKILALVTHTTNIPLSRKRLTLELVSSQKIKKKILEKKSEAQAETTISLKEELALLWEEIESQESIIKILEDEKLSAQLEAESLLDQKEDLDTQLRAEKYKNKVLQASQGFKNRENGEQETTTIAALDFLCRGDQPTPRECLELIEKIFPERIEVLQSAYTSADEVEDFSHSVRLLDMLRRLATVYFDAMLEGGDSKAMKVFTNSEYSATESDTVANNSAYRQKRIFQRNEKELEMFRHLKIGKADDTRLTIRVHFAWIGDEKKIVIGYCGEHLPIKNH